MDTNILILHYHYRGKVSELENLFRMHQETSYRCIPFLIICKTNPSYRIEYKNGERKFSCIADTGWLAYKKKLHSWHFPHLTSVPGATSPLFSWAFAQYACQETSLVLLRFLNS